MANSNAAALHIIVSLTSRLLRSMIPVPDLPDMLENMAFVVGAVLAGNMTKLGAGFMNQMLAWYLVSRVAYLIAYVQVEKEQYATLRTLFYNLGATLLVVIYVKAAGVLAKN